MSNFRDIVIFLEESNAIENEHSTIAFEDAFAAWKYAETRALICITDILIIHLTLMQRLRPDIAGEYRKCAVRIGGKIKKEMKLEDFSLALLGVTNYMLESFKLDTNEEREEACKKAHVMFEEIHPFLDGNGRVGRIIYNWHRLALGLPLHIIHVGDEQYEYYTWFR